MNSFRGISIKQRRRELGARRDSKSIVGCGETANPIAIVRHRSHVIRVLRIEDYSAM
jgi:hypothetical protein